MIYDYPKTLGAYKITHFGVPGIRDYLNSWEIEAESFEVTYDVSGITITILSCYDFTEAIRELSLYYQAEIEFLLAKESPVTSRGRMYTGLIMNGEILEKWATDCIVKNGKIIKLPDDNEAA